jgi:pimeloyl-ACP methyl ester carboxylesterase
METLGRLTVRSNDRDEPTTWQTRHAQYDAVCAWGIPDHSPLQRAGAIDMPVFVANGDSDPMILPHYSYLLAGLIPQAQVKVYPDSAHGFLFQHPVCEENHCSLLCRIPTRVRPGCHGREAETTGVRLSRVINEWVHRGL